MTEKMPALSYFKRNLENAGSTRAGVKFRTATQKQDFLLMREAA